MTYRPTYKVYFSASDGNDYYMSMNGKDYLSHDGEQAVRFGDPDDAKVGIRQFMKMREWESLNPYPVDNDGETLSGKFIIKTIPIPSEHQNQEPEIELQDRKRKSSKSKARKPVKKVTKKVVKKCKCK